MDTPEVYGEKECSGEAAKRVHQAVAKGRRVQREFDVEGVDRYQRTLAYVWVGERLFNEVLVRQGLAHVSTYPPNVKYVDRFLAAQREARCEARGLWRRCAVGEGTRTGGSAPSRWRREVRASPARSSRAFAGGRGQQSFPLAWIIWGRPRRVGPANPAYVVAGDTFAPAGRVGVVST